MFRAPAASHARRVITAPVPPRPPEFDEPFETEPDAEFEPGPAALPPRLRVRWWLVRWLLILGVWSVLSGLAVLLWFAWGLPSPSVALESARRPTLALADSTGHVFATYGDVVGDKVHLSDLPAWLPLAAVAVEDRRFWTHWGIDLQGIGRAAWVNLLAGRVVQGGSTLTQQVAKNLFLTNGRTFSRKVQEVMLTLWLEQIFTKQQILEIWLNRVYLGSGAWGVDAAARLYFGIPARQMNLAQCAVIAGLPRAPSRFSPRADPQAAAARGRQVLAAMVAAGSVTAAQAQAAAAQMVFPQRPASAAGWFADWAADQAQALLPPGQDAVARTTLDPALQATAEARLRAVLNGPGAAAGVEQGAVVVLDAASGAVRAMVGGRDYRTAPYNRAVMARRQPGSAFKAFVWLAALEAGVRPEDSIADAPITVDGWSPANFDHRFRGRVTVEDGLADSLNTVSVRLMQQAGGPAAVAAVAHRLGIADALSDSPTLALGTADVGVLEMASAYGALFDGGLRAPPVGIAAITADQREVTVFRPPPPRVADAQLSAMMARMLTAVVTRGSGHLAALPGRAVAGKTGTSQDYRDAWFVGAVSGQVIAVWLGRDDDRPMREVTGGSLPAQLFHDIAMAIPPA